MADAGATNAMKSSSDSMSGSASGETQGKHVEFLLVAEFDIDVGSGMKFQYPRSCGAEESYLAEMMLPDGLHKRDDDWTIFFLNRPKIEAPVSLPPPASTSATPSASTSSPSTEPKEPKEKPAEPEPKSIEAFFYELKADDENNDAEPSWQLLGKTKKLVYFLPNALQVKEKDGTLVATIVSHPALELSELEERFLCILAEDDRALGFRVSTSEEADALCDHVQKLIELQDVDPAVEEEKKRKEEEEQRKKKEQEEERQRKAAEEQERKRVELELYGPLPKGFLYCLNRVSVKKEETVRRGARYKALALCTRHQYLHIFKPILILALDKLFSCPPGTEKDVLKEVYDAINSMDISGMPNPNDHQKAILRAGSDKSKHKVEYNTNVALFNTKLPVKIPFTMFSDEVGNFSIIPLVNKFGRSTMTIFNAMLTQKRVLFIGFECTAEDVCSYVLAAVSMVCPPLRGLVHRCFPYTNLTHLEFLEVPGYIAGVANPMFEERTEWWDVCCNIRTGKVTVNPKLGNFEEACAKLDNEFFALIQYNVQEHYGQDQVKSLFQAYCQHILDIATGDEEFVDETHAKEETEANRARIEAWRKTIAAARYEEDRQLKRVQSSIPDPQVPRLIRRLRTRRIIPEAEMLEMMGKFVENIKTEQQMIEFLSYFPESSGGLFPVAVSLFHESDAVRSGAFELFRRLDKIKTGSGFIAGLNFFLMLAYDRLTQKTLNERKEGEK